MQILQTCYTDKCKFDLPGLLIEAYASRDLVETTRTDTDKTFSRVGALQNTKSSH